MSIAVEITQISQTRRRYKPSRRKRFAKATIGALAAASACAAIWVLLSSYIPYRLGFMSVVVAVGTGLAVRRLGDSRNEAFGTLATVVTFFSSFAAELFSGVIQAAQLAQKPLFIFVQTLTFESTRDIFRGNLLLFDAFFYAVALLGAYHLAIYNNCAQPK